MGNIEWATHKEIIKRAPQIGVVGASTSNLPLDLDLRNRMLKDAEEVGREIARAGAILISGGTDGIMEASSKGAFEEGDLTVGTPGKDRNSSNQYIRVEICTPIDVGDYLFAGILSSDSLVVFPGGAGTMAEIALAYRYKKPMIVFQGYDTWYDSLVGKSLDPSNKITFMGASTPKDAIQTLLDIYKTSKE